MIYLLACRTNWSGWRPACS